MTISIIVAIADNGVIGNNGALPWHQAADLRHFKALTTGQAVIMGRATYESIGRPLPNRQNIVISRDTAYQAAGCTVVHSLQGALAAAKGDEAFIIGGATVYGQSLALAARLYLTLVHSDTPGDTHFDYQPALWREVSREDYQADDSNDFPYSFVELHKA